jgi:hypothetical protein
VDQSNALMFSGCENGYFGSPLLDRPCQLWPSRLQSTPTVTALLSGFPRRLETLRKHEQLRLLSSTGNNDKQRSMVVGGGHVRVLGDERHISFRPAKFPELSKTACGA